MKYYTLFQAWQSQDEEYSKFITKAIKEVVKTQEKKGILIKIIRFPAQDDSGSPDVVNKIWEQIANCDFFIGDLSCIKEDSNRHYPNMNVMYETGIADALLGENRVILVHSAKTNPEKLGFDINHKRLSLLDKNKKDQSVKCLNEWVEAAIKECDIQNIQRDFALDDIYRYMFILYNNFMRLVFFDNFDYLEGVLPPTLEVIENRLDHAKWYELMISLEYTPIVNTLKELIQKMYFNHNRREIIEIINIYEALNNYSNFICTADKSILFAESGEYPDFIINDNSQFLIQRFYDYETSIQDMNSPLFKKDVIYISNKISFSNVFAKECLSAKTLDVCRYQEVPSQTGKLGCMKMKEYKIEKAAIPVLSKLIYYVLQTVFQFMDKQNYYPSNIKDDWNNKTIITWMTK